MALRFIHRLTLSQPVNSGNSKSNGFGVFTPKPFDFEFLKNACGKPCIVRRKPSIVFSVEQSVCVYAIARRCALVRNKCRWADGSHRASFDCRLSPKCGVAGA